MANSDFDFRVVIPTLNGGAKTRRLVDVLSRTVGSGRVLIIDSSSDDGSAQYAKAKGCEVVVIDRMDFDHGRTRTLGAKAANAEIIVFMTQDVLPVDDCVETLIRGLRNDPECWAAFGRQLPFPSADPNARYLRAYNYPRDSYRVTIQDAGKRGIKTIFFSDAFSAYRKEALEKIGWFADGLIFGEDTEICARILKAGGCVRYVAEAGVMHSHNYGFVQEFRRSFDIGVFHESRKNIFADFGGAEGEGWRFARSFIAYLFRDGKWYYSPREFMRLVVKYLGYALGHRAENLPFPVRRTFSGAPRYWGTRKDMKWMLRA